MKWKDLESNKLCGPRIVVWFSCGAASAVAAKLAVDEYKGKHPVEIVYCDVSQDEHLDNKRFMADVSEWVGQDIKVIQSDKYQSVEQVWAARNYMAGIQGAPCMVEMKKVPRFAFQRPDDIHVFGLTADETKRIHRLVKNNFDLAFDWILVRYQVSKSECFRRLLSADIELPVMYRLGFRNNNCIGCVKATSMGYWDMIREHFSEVFEKRAQQSRQIGTRLTRYRGERIFLDELPEGIDRSRYQLEGISCGPDCADDQT